MRNFFSVFAVIGALATGGFATSADAFSLSPVPELNSHVTLVAGGCGIGFHRGPAGGCLPNGVGYGYGGVYRGGLYRGGVYRGGVYRGGVYRGGVHRGGAFRGGVHRGGRVGRRSDFRLKHDITLLGYMPNGLGFYRFVYNGGRKAYVGVIAQEVKRVVPQAVFRGQDGYLSVDYNKIGVKFETYNRWVATGAQIPSSSTPWQ